MFLTRKEIEKLIKKGKIDIKIEEVTEYGSLYKKLSIRDKLKYVTDHGIELTISRYYYKIKSDLNKEVIDLEHDWSREIYVFCDGFTDIVIPPKSFIIMTTVEYISLPEDVAGICCLRSTCARWGLIIPPTIVDAGFEGVLAIELFNANDYTVKIPVGAKMICLALFKTKGKNMYKGFYRGQSKLQVLPKNLKNFNVYSD